MLIYRVENQDGRGPFHKVYEIMDEESHIVYDGYLDQMFGDYSRHPPPTDEMVSRGVFGCSTLESLAEWFDHSDVRKMLTAVGFSISIYKVKNVMHGINQVSFAKKNAKLINILPLAHLKGIS